LQVSLPGLVCPDPQQNELVRYWSPWRSDIMSELHS